MQGRPTEIWVSGLLRVVRVLKVTKKLCNYNGVKGGRKIDTKRS